jgi:rubrerythrin
MGADPGTFDTVESILAQAIAMEMQAARMYENAADRSATEPIRDRLLEMAGQEWAHKARLEEIQSGNVRWAMRRAKADAVPDLRISDHLLGGSLEPDADYQDVLIFAARREKTAHDFYQAMSEKVDDALIRDVFEMLAAEELRHKYLLEKTYEELAYQDF